MEVLTGDRANSKNILPHVRSVSMNNKEVMEKVVQAVVQVQEVSGRATGVIGSGDEAHRWR